jgi:hypothetical protein
VIHMKAVKTIQSHIKQIPRGKPFTVASLNKLASYANNRQVLSRLVKSGEITRAARGIFVRPKEVPYLGKVLPESREIAETIGQISGEHISTHGAEAARILQLSTQVPMQPIFYTTGNTRHIKLGNQKIILKHISAKKLVKPGTIVGLAISALWYLGKNNVNSSTIKKIKQQLQPEQFAELLECSSQMPAWMSNLFYRYHIENSHGK